MLDLKRRPTVAGARMVDQIARVYRHDPRPLVVGFSGGKDSTVALCETLHGVTLAGGGDKPVYVVFSDTGLEPSMLLDGIHRTLDRLENYAAERGLPVTVLRVRPGPTETLLAKVVGEGMTLPDRQKRWCTEKMKIRPSEKALVKILARHEGFIAVTGVRSEESADRARRIAVRERAGEILADHDRPGCASLMPIADWSAADVWGYLFDGRLTPPFVDTAWLAEIYAEASGDGDECASMVAGSVGETPGCSRSGRFGCVVCPLAYGADRMLKNLGYRYTHLQEVERFRDWLMEYQTGRWHECRDVYNHGRQNRLRYNRDNQRKGMVSPGGFSLAFRREILRRLRRLDGFLTERGERPLLSPKELAYIQERWILEGDLSRSAFAIYGEAPPLSIKARMVERLARRLVCLAEKRPQAILRLGLRPEQCGSRFFAQLALWSLGREEGGRLAEALFSRDPLLADAATREISGSPVVRDQFHPTPLYERAIREEWRRDALGVHLFDAPWDEIKKGPAELGLFGYTGPGARALEVVREIEEENRDWLDSEHLSLDEKCAILEEWNRGEDLAPLFA